MSPNSNVVLSKNVYGSPSGATIWQLAGEDLFLSLCAAFNSSNTHMDKTERLKQNILCLNVFSQDFSKLGNFTITDKSPELMSFATNEVVTHFYQLQLGFNH